jgi:hypothetical protein
MIEPSLIPSRSSLASKELDQATAATAPARFEHAWQLAVEVEAIVSTSEGQPLEPNRYEARVVLSLARSLVEELEQILDAR